METDRRDPYGAIKSTLPLLDLMHRVLLPGISGDIASFMAPEGMGRVLDVACGTGYTACALHRRGLEVVGIDLSPAMLAQAKRKAGACSFVLGDGTRLPFGSGRFDAALVSLALHEIPPGAAEAVWEEMKRVVRPGGCLFALDFAALPARRSAWSRIVAEGILRVERSTLKYDPDHWHNSQKFQEMGGLDGWLEGAAEKILGRRSYLGGNVILALVEN